MTSIVPHTFSLPSWMFDIFPPEIWAIIYKYKYQIEMKPIISEFMWYKKRRYNTAYSRDHDDKYYVCLGHNKYVRVPGTNPNEWTIEYRRRKNEWPDKRLVRVLDKCGIEWFGDSTMDIHMDTKETLRRHIIEDLGLKCAKSWKREKMIAQLQKA